jgi:glycosyltransferase involved in cell wall biosynthesis
MARDRTILYVIGSLDLGGSERHLALILPRLRKLGWRVCVFCLTHEGTQAADLMAEGVEIIGPPLGSLRGRHFLGALRLALSSIKLLTIMIRRRPAIVHFFLPASYVLGGPLAILTRIPTRIMSRRSLNLYHQDHPLVGAIERRLHRRMSAILGNSRQVVRELIDVEGCPRERVGIIYNGIDVSCFEAAALGCSQTEPSRPNTSNLVLIINANLIPYKGHADLISALSMIADRLPPDWQLLCIGGDYGFGAKLRQQIRELELGDHIRFLGQRRDVASLLCSADIGLLCSHQEGFANAVLEGMAAGLPMIATDVGGNAEAVVHGKTGFVVPPRDPHALGQAILELAGDAQGRHVMGKTGLERVKSHFTIDRCVSEYDRLYGGLLRGQLPAQIEGIAAPSLSQA